MYDTPLPPTAHRARRRRLAAIHRWIGGAALLFLTACQPAGVPGDGATATASPVILPSLTPPRPPQITLDPTAAPRRAASLTPAPCPFTLPGETEGEGYACGILRVPQFRDDPTGTQIGIFYAQLKATQPDADQPPLLFLAGGPGASGVYDAPVLAPVLAPLRQTRDLLFFDIRGAGFSQPRLDCTTLADAGFSVVCMAALRAQGFEPMAFNTPQNAADAADLLTELGYARADLFGVSYGTRLALEMMRSQPQVVRAAVLDSTVAPETLTYELQALGDFEAKLWPFADCEATPACRGRFGAMAGRFLALLNRLDEEGGALQQRDITLDASALYNITNLAVNRPDLMALLPLMVDELDRGVAATYRAVRDGEFGETPVVRAPVYAFDRFIPRFDAYLRTLAAPDAAALREGLAGLPAKDPGNAALAAFLAANLPAPLAGELRAIVAPLTPYEHDRLLAAYGADLTLYDHHDLGAVKTIIDCQEEIPFVDPEALRKNQAVIPAPSLLPAYDFADSVRREQETCRALGLAPAPASFKDAVQSDKPVLLLAGAQDTVTPRLWAQLAAAALPNAVFVTFPAYGHALLYNTGACVAQIARAFLDAPARPPTTDCVPAIDYAVEPPLRVALTGRMWRLQGWAGEAAGELPVTAFFRGGMVGGLAGCGAYSGEFTLTGDALTITSLDAPAQGCTAAAHTLQAAFLADLAAATSIYIRGNRMLLTTATGDLLIFTAETDLPLEQTLWTLVATAAGAGGALTPLLPDVGATARFADGNMMGGLGCNLYEASYQLEGDSLQLGELRSPDAVECAQPPGVMVQEQMVRDLLAATHSYRIIGRELLLYADDGEPMLVYYAVTE